jgi:hypothetical protein
LIAYSPDCSFLAYAILSSILFFNNGTIFMSMVPSFKAVDLTAGSKPIVCFADEDRHSTAAPWAKHFVV